jgi:BclB C-terminal domain-containing protein
MSDITLQIERSASGAVANGNAVIFENVVFSSGDIDYNNGTGVITFNEAGRYVVNWWVATQTTLSGNGVTFALSSSQGDLISGSSPIKTGTVTGTGIIQVTQAPVTLSLINVSTADIFLSSPVPLKASLVVVQDDIPSVGSGAIIPFASGTPVTLTTVLGGMFNASSGIGFGNSFGGIIIIAGSFPAINLANMAFSMPRNGTITSMAAFFSTTAALELADSTITLTARLFQSTAPDNTFTGVPGAVATLSPPLNGSISVGTVSSGITTDMSIPVTAGTRLLMLFSANVTAGTDTAGIIAGYASAGLTIS